jgi:hypothetical protein
MLQILNFHNITLNMSQKQYRETRTLNYKIEIHIRTLIKILKYNI